MIPKLRLEMKKRAIRFALFRSLHVPHQRYAICEGFRHQPHTPARLQTLKRMQLVDRYDSTYCTHRR
jgi:hypothetical protein